MAKIYQDIPVDMLSFLKRINFSAIPENQRASKLAELEKLTSQHVSPRKKHNVPMIDIDIPNEAAQFINKYDFAGVSKFKQIVAKPIIVAYLKNNNLLK